MGIEYRDADSAATIANYERRAEAFWAATRDHDVTQNYAALLDAIAAPIGEGGGGRRPPFAILDLGCGPGRDLRWFRDQGHEAVGPEHYFLKWNCLRRGVARRSARRGAKGDA